MNVYVIDHTYDGEEPTRCSWGFLVNIFSALSPEISFEGSPSNNCGGFDNADAVFFVHVSGQEQEWRDRANVASCHIVLLRGAGRQHETPIPHGTLHGCHWSPNEFRDPSNARVQKFISQILRGERVDWELLNPDPVEPILAAKLIVEARACAGQSSGGVQIHAIEEPLFQAAMAVKNVADTGATNTEALMSAIETFENTLTL